MAEVQEILSKLGFIAAIESGERVDTTSLNVQSGITGRVWRAFFSRGESRQVTYEFIKEVTDEALVATERYTGRRSGEPNLKMGNKFIDALSESIKGIDALKATYSGDRMFVARLTTLADLLAMRIGELKPLFEVKN